MLKKIIVLRIWGKMKKGIVVSDHQYQHNTDVSDKLYLIKAGKTYLLKPEKVNSQLKDHL